MKSQQHGRTYAANLRDASARTAVVRLLYNGSVAVAANTIVETAKAFGVADDRAWLNSIERAEIARLDGLSNCLERDYLTVAEIFAEARRRLHGDQ